MSLSVVKEALDVLDKLNHLPTGPITFTNAVFSIFHVINAILITDGAAGWYQKVNEVLEQEVLTPEEERLLEPIVQFVLQLKQARPADALESIFQRGGGMDEAYAKGLQYIKDINKQVSQFAAKSGMGITQFQLDHDLQPDLHPLAVLRPVHPIIGPILASIPLPYRTIIFIVHSALDLVRLLTANIPLMRQVLSVSLAGVELLKGNWKKALLSLSGLLSTSMVYIGFVGKLFLELFSLMSPQLQDSIAFGTLRVTKSVLLGFLLEIFKITATEGVRKGTVTLFKELAAREHCLNTVLGAAGLGQRPDEQGEPHGVIEDQARNCSAEFKEVIQAAKQSVLVSIILQLANIPTSEEGLQLQCSKFAAQLKKEGHTTWKDLLVAEGLMNLVHTEKAEGSEEIEEASNEASDELKEDPRFKELMSQLDELKLEIPRAVKEEKEAAKALEMFLQQVQKTPPQKEELVSKEASKSSLMPSLPSMPSMPSLPSMSSVSSPIHADININWPASPGASKSITESPAGPTESPTGTTESPAGPTGPTGTTESPTGPTESPTGPTESPTGSTPSSSSTPSPPPPPSPPSDGQTSSTPSENSKNTTPPSDQKGGFDDYSYSEND